MATLSAQIGDPSAGLSRHQTPGTAGCLLILCIALAAVGCRRGPVLGKVHGRVAFSGKPIQSGIVGFSNPQTGVNMTANVDDQGRYEVSMAKGYGLPLGMYRVAVYPFVADLPIGSTERPKPREFPDIPERYRRPETSRLSIEVHPGDNPFDIEMEP
jgi:hypothetical protein